MHNDRIVGADKSSNAAVIWYVELSPLEVRSCPGMAFHVFYVNVFYVLYVCIHVKMRLCTIESLKNRERETLKNVQTRHTCISNISSPFMLKNLSGVYFFLH
jgi:hypothetical protein